MNLLKRKPKTPSKIIRHCPRWTAGYYCKAEPHPFLQKDPMPCFDCGRGVKQA